MKSIDQLTPGERITLVVRVLEEPTLTRIKGKDMVKIRIGDLSGIANLVLWSSGKDLGLKKGDVIEISNGECPKSHEISNRPPTIAVVQETKITKKSVKFPSIEECMQRRFLEQIPDYSYGITECLISQVYRTVSYFCNRCKKFSDEMCDCGNFPSPIFRISGMLTDGSKTVLFSTTSERAAERLSGVGKKEAKRLDPRDMMKMPHLVLGYLRGDKFYLEDVI